MAYEIKELGVGGTLDQTFAILKDHFVKIMTVVGVLYISVNLILGLITVAFTPTFEPGASPREIIEASGGNGPILGILILVSALLNLFIAPLTNAALVQTIAHLYLDKDISVGEAFRLGLRRYGPIIWTSILYSFLVFLGFLCFIIPGIYLSLRWALALDVVILEEKSGSAALKRSSELMLSNRSRHYNTIFLVFLVVFIIQFSLGFVSGLVPVGALRVVVQTIIFGLSMALGATALVVFYFSCRCRADNFDIVHLTETLNVQDESNDRLDDEE